MDADFRVAIGRSLCYGKLVLAAQVRSRTVP